MDSKTPDPVAIEALAERLAQDPSLVTEAAGWKVALNFASVQRKLGLTGPLAAPLARLQTHDSGARLTPAEGALLHVEAELALRLAADARRESDPLAVEWVAPCLELVDYSLPRSGLSAMFAHSFFHAGIVLGAPRPLAQLSMAAPYPRTDDRQRIPGCVPDDVLDALARLRTFVLAAGAVLRRGQLVLCGSYIEPAALGVRVEVDFGAQLGTLSIER